jgi:hypothetical protein
MTIFKVEVSPFVASAGSVVGDILKPTQSGLTLMAMSIATAMIVATLCLEIFYHQQAGGEYFSGLSAFDRNRAIALLIDAVLTAFATLA